MRDAWAAVDRYLDGVFGLNDAELEAALQESATAGLPPIQVSPSQGKLLHLLARLQGARRILEIGTLGGYSTIWLGRALPADGKLITLESEPRHAEIARRNLTRAGLADKVQMRIGPALDSLAGLASENAAPFDLFFIDADKTSLAEYFEWSLRLARVGSLIIADNVVRNGAVVDPASRDDGVQGVRRFLDRVSREPRVTGAAIQAVGVKGHDGFAILLVIA